MPRIPVNPTDLPTEVPPIEDGSIQDVVIKEFKSKGTDKNDVEFGALRVEVLGGEWEGRTLYDYYVPYPIVTPPNASKAERQKLDFINVKMGRIAKCFNVKARPDGFDPEEDLLGLTGKITIQNREYPEGSGTMRSGIGEYLI